LNVSANQSLINLYCTSNLLTGLDVSKNIYLKLLDCTGNSALKTVYVWFAPPIPAGVSILTDDGVALVKK
jgi:hypothetical protein